MNYNEEDDPAYEGLGDLSQFYAGMMKEVVPQKSHKLQDILNRHSVRFCMNESEERIYFGADSGSGLITVGLRGTTRLMAHVFAYTSAHLAQHLKILNKNNGTPLPDNHQAMLDRASRLLTWAVTEDVRGSLPSFEKSFVPQFMPDDLAELVQECLPEEFQALAARLFANSFVWVLFHELSHIQMQHVYCKGLISIEQEKEADRMAAEWMLDACGELAPHESCERQ